MRITFADISFCSVSSLAVGTKDGASPGWQKGTCSTPPLDLSSWRCLFVPALHVISAFKVGIAMGAACRKQRSLRDFESELGLENMLTLTQLNDL